MLNPYAPVIAEMCDSLKAEICGVVKQLSVEQLIMLGEHVLSETHPTMAALKALIKEEPKP